MFGQNLCPQDNNLLWNIALQFQKFKQECFIYIVAYKYNLLSVLKILSYTFYSNSTDETQARNIMSARNKQATFSLCTTLIMKLKDNQVMQRLAHW